MASNVIEDDLEMGALGDSNAIDDLLSDLETKATREHVRSTLATHGVQTLQDIEALSIEAFNELLADVPGVVQNRLGIYRRAAIPTTKKTLISEHDMLAVPLLILSSIGIVFVLYSGKDILVPFVISAFLVYLLRPLFLFLTTPFSKLGLPCCTSDDELPARGVNASESTLLVGSSSRGAIYSPVSTNSSDSHRRQIDLPAIQCCPFRFRRLPAAVAALITLSVAVSFLVGIVFLIIHSVQVFEAESLQLYEDEAANQIARLSSWANDTFHVDASQVVIYVEGEAEKKFPLTDFLQTTILFLFNTVSLITVILLFILYMLPDQVHNEEDTLRGKIDKQITHYIVLKSFISFLAACAVFIIQGPIFQLPMAFLFACLTFIFNFIPNIGAFIASCIPLPFILLDPALGDVDKVLCFTLPVAVHIIVGNWVEPTMFGQKLELHPITVLLCLAFWFALWGVPGAILSVPITAVIRIVLTHFKHPYAIVALEVLEGTLGSQKHKDR